MNKSKFLTLATTAAVIATTAGTFAAWDTLTSQSAGTVTIRQATKVTSETINFDVDNPVENGDGKLEYTGTLKVDIENIGASGVNKLTFTPTTNIGDVEILDGDVALINNTDSQILGSNEYKVKLTVSNTNAGQTANVNIDVEAGKTI